MEMKNQAAFLLGNTVIFLDPWFSVPTLRQVGLLPVSNKLISTCK